MATGEKVTSSLTDTRTLVNLFVFHRLAVSWSEAYNYVVHVSMILWHITVPEWIVRGFHPHWPTLAIRQRIIPCCGITQVVLYNSIIIYRTTVYLYYHVHCTARSWLALLMLCCIAHQMILKIDENEKKYTDLQPSLAHYDDACSLLALQNDARFLLNTILGTLSVVSVLRARRRATSRLQREGAGR